MSTEGSAARRRDRVAHATLRRVEYQRATLSTRYGQANGPLPRLVAVTAALRAAAQPGSHQIEHEHLNRLLNAAVDAVHAAVDELHHRQQRRAERVLTTPERRNRDHQPDRPRRAGPA